MKVNLLILGASSDQLCMIKKASALGLGTVVLDADICAPGFKLADYSAPIDFSNVPQVIKFCRTLMDRGVDISGVSTMGSDVPHLLSKIASYFGWYAPTEEAALLTTNKFLMKQRLVAQGIPVPRFSLVGSPDEVVPLWRYWECDSIVIKPTDRAGSRGVHIIDDESAIAEAYENAQIVSLNGEVLVEEFIAGRQISTESFLLPGFQATPGFADRVYEGMSAFWPNVMENGGWIPSSLCDDRKSEVSKLVETAARALGIESGVAKGDVVICPKRGPMIIEIAARLSGGDFAESLVPISTGIDYVSELIKLAVGLPVDISKLTSGKNRKKVVANRYFFPKSGLFLGCEGLDWLSAHPRCEKVEIFWEVGDQVGPIKSHSDRAGVFVITGDTRDEVQELICEAYRKVKFNIDGVWVDGAERLTLNTV